MAFLMMTSDFQKSFFVSQAEHVRSVRVERTILQKESFLRDQAEMRSSPYQAFGGLVPQPPDCARHTTAGPRWAFFLEQRLLC